MADLGQPLPAGPAPLAPPPLTIEAVEQLKKKELRRRVNERFLLAETRGVEERPGHMQEAEFYLRVLQERRDRWIARRDLLLEIVVIVLIGWEIYMSYRGERLQTSNFKEEKVVYDNLQKSSKATADSLESVKGSLDTMNGALQKQVALFYDVDVNIMFDQASKVLSLNNMGRTGVTMWGSKVADNVPTIQTEGRTIPAGGAYGMKIADIYDRLAAKFPKPQQGKIPFEVFLKNERNEEFVQKGYFTLVWENNAGVLKVQIVSVVPERWSWKYGKIARPD